MSSRVGAVVKRQMSTPSSNDAEIDQLSVQLNMSTDSGDYEVPPPLLNSEGRMSDGKSRGAEETGRRARSTKQVTADARRILDRFFRIADEMSRRRQRRVGAAGEDSPAEGSLYDASETEHQYAIVEEIFHDLLPTPYQPMGSVSNASFF